MRSIPVQLPHTSYEIVVGTGLLQDLDRHLEKAALAPPYLIVSQPGIFKSVGQGMRKKFPVVLLPDGERAKTLGSVSRLLDQMAALKLTRDSTLIALGGGVVGDVAGFAASIYMRGIAFVQAPTTLLAQVDSSIGGKTGVNHRLAKNLIGTFHQPRLVLSDIGALGSLPAREYASGLYEALKYGVILRADLFKEFERGITTFLKRESAAVERLVAQCAAIKAAVVMVDEREGDLRRILNFGHTVGHALEASAGYRRIRHGEAVGYGMIAATRMAGALGMLQDEDHRRIEAAVLSIGRLPALNGVTSKATLAALQHDKKIRDGALHFVLPRAIGKVEVTPRVPFEVVRKVVKEILRKPGLRS
jgi:3-dehydroquinate synthase